MCPSCDWPRQHSDETPPRDGIWCADPNAQFTVAQMPVIQQHLVDVKIVPPAPPAPAMAEAALPDLGIFEVAVQPSSMTKLRTLTLAPEDPPPEIEE